jgi:hypothetical protein
MDSPDELRSPEEPSSIPDSQDSVQRVVNSFIRGSQGSEPTSGANVVPVCEASHTYQTSNHYELDEGRDREHVEYSINHRLVSWCIHSSPVFGSMGTSGHAGRPVRCFLRGIPF